MKRRLIVGLTGAFGSGKSTIGRILKRLGARKVINSDRLAHEIFRPGHKTGKKIKLLFQMKGPLNRKVIAQEVFSNSRKRKQLESMVHPYVYRRIREELDRIPSGIVILEVPLLFETRFNRLCNVTIAVLAGERNIIKRLSRAGFSSEGARARLRAQWSEKRKKQRADLYIQNSGSKMVLTKRTKLMWQKLVSIFNEKENLRGA